MKSIKALIVEDELLIAETIKLYLNERGHSVIGIAISYEETIQLLKEENPDVILLDVRLYGEKSGIDVANHLLDLGNNIPYIIVSSLYDSKIVEDAMYAGAAGYITKPISKETLWTSIELAVLKLEDNIANETYIDLKTGQHIQRIKLKDIIYIKSAHVYVEVVCTSSKYICRYALYELLNMIDTPYFIQCNRSYIINIKKIQRYSASKIWINDEVIPIGAKHKEALAKIIQNLGTVNK